MRLPTTRARAPLFPDKAAIPSPLHAPRSIKLNVTLSKAAATIERRSVASSSGGLFARSPPVESHFPGESNFSVKLFALATFAVIDLRLASRLKITAALRGEPGRANISRPSSAVPRRFFHKSSHARTHALFIIRSRRIGQAKPTRTRMTRYASFIPRNNYRLMTNI